MPKVTSPVAGFNGTVAGVQFEDGKAETDSAAALAYFARHRYGIGSSKPTPPERPEPADPREVSAVRVGTPVRDGAVDPRPGDYLGPTNAGQANPHGPLVVNPEIHGSGPTPIHPGDVHTDDPAAQDAQETALTEAVLVENADVTAATVQAAQGNDARDAPPEPPGGKASKSDWRAYALAQPGVTEADIDGLTRDQLRDRYSSEG
jgi:hypothetical protein